MELAAIAVMPLGSGDDLDLLRSVKLTYAAQYLPQDRDFLFELILVIRVLIMAAPADSEVGASWLNPGRDSLIHGDEPGMQVILSLHRSLFAGQDEGSQHDTAIHARETFAPVYELFDCNDVGHCTMGFVRPT